MVALAADAGGPRRHTCPPTTKRKATKTGKLAEAGKRGKADKRGNPRRSAALADQQVEDTLAWLKRHGTKRTRDGMAGYGIFTDKAFGVPMATMLQLAKRLGRNHSLAAALWATGWYEARMVAAFVADPAQVTPAQMDRWRRDFDNWAICDTVCFHLFDRTPHAWRKVAAVVPAGATSSASARPSPCWRAWPCTTRAGVDQPFADSLALVEAAAGDQRNFVKKAVSWALRAIGRRNSALNNAAVTVARRLALSTAPPARWIGKDALRDLTSPATLRRLTSLHHRAAV